MLNKGGESKVLSSPLANLTHLMVEQVNLCQKKAH